jgi:hypothetical protein
VSDMISPAIWTLAASLLKSGRRAIRCVSALLSGRSVLRIHALQPVAQPLQDKN